MRASIAAELRKLSRRPAVWLLLVVWVLLGAIFGYAIPYAVYASGGAGGQAQLLLTSMLPESYVSNVVSGFPFFGFAIALLLGALATAGEYGWRTFATVLAQRPSRTAVLGGKLAALIAVLAVFVVASFAIAAVGSAAVEAAEGTGSAWPGAGEILRGVGAAWLMLAVSAVIGAFLGLAFRTTGLAVGLGLVYVLVIESLIQGFAGQSSVVRVVAEALPGVNAGSLAASFVSGSGGTPGLNQLVDAGQGALVLAAWGVGLSCIGLAIFRRQDIGA
jgi:ABC-type transport system involved in multi-copper enzyme maturation permease subunit